MDWGIPPFTGGYYLIADSTSPIGGKSESVGYAYLSAPPNDIESRLPTSVFPIEIHGGHGYRRVFRPITKNWYLFYDAEW